MAEDGRCDEARRIGRIDDAFRRGDLEALRAAVEDPAVVPNGRMPDAIGTCLVYAIYHSPIAFIRTLLELGADPRAPVSDGFPPLLAALARTHDAPGAPRRTDVDRVLRVLLAFGADPDGRGINDYTPLHMAVAERNADAVQLLLDAGADRDLRTRIDDCQTPLEMAEAAGLADIAALLRRDTYPRRLRSGLTLLSDIPGGGEPVCRQQSYRVRLRLWLASGDAVRWDAPPGPPGTTMVEDDGHTLVTDIRVSRGSLINGVFYGIEGMRVGGTRRIDIAPNLAYGTRGVPGLIPADAPLRVEITILEGPR